MKKIILALTLAFSVNASIVISIYEDGNDVKVVSTGGSLDLTGLSGEHFAERATDDFFAGTLGLHGIFANSASHQYRGDINYSLSENWTARDVTISFDQVNSSMVLMLGPEGGATDGIFVSSGYVSGESIPSFTGTITKSSLFKIGLTADSSLTANWAADSLTIQAIPEPSTIYLIGLSGGGLLFYIRPKFRSHRS